MRSDVSQARLEVLHEHIVPAFVAMLDDASPLDHPAELEQLAATVLVPLEQPEMPAAVAAAVFAAVEARRDPDAAGVLAALAALAGEPLARQAASRARRLAADGVVSAAAGVGMLAVQEAVRVEGAGVELLVALLRRPGARELQPAMLAIEHEHTGGALVQCALAPPARFKDARDLLDGVGGPGAPNPSRPASWPRASSLRPTVRSTSRLR